MNRLKESLIVFMALLFAITGCATYKRTSIEVGALDTYKSKMSTKGITVAADPIDNEIEAKESFYVDVTKANFFPILLIAQNDTSDRIIFMKESAELTDPKGNYYRPVSSAVMADALEHNKMVYALLGFGIFSYMSAEEANRKMASDWRDKELQDTFIINPGRKRHGFLYFELPKGETPSGYKLTFVVESLESKEKFPFEIVLPTTNYGLELSEEGSQKLAYNVNPEEPWTGVWKVESSSMYQGGIWALKQSGKTVVSTRQSRFKLKGKVEGNQLKGKWYSGPGGVARTFAIKISSDGQSFKGTADVWQGTAHLKGKRKE